MEKEAEAVKELLSRLTNAVFKVEEPKPNHPLSRAKLKWFVLCPDTAYVRQTAHAEAAWADAEDTIWIESSVLGFSTDWVEQAYGEKGAVKSMHMDSPDLANPQFRREFAKEFPLVMERIDAYEKIASQVSSRQNVHLDMRYSKSNVATITLTAKIEAKGMDLQSKLKAIEKNVGAMKEAHQEIKDLLAEFKESRQREVEKGKPKHLAIFASTIHCRLNLSDI